MVFGVRVRKPVSSIVKGLCPKEFKDEQHNLLTKHIRFLTHIHKEVQ